MSEPKRPRGRSSGVGRRSSLAGPTADEQIVRELYAEHATALLGFVTNLLDGDRQRAEDVVQETLLRAWRHPEALSAERGSTRSWLFTVARNLVVDGQRARAARPREVSDAALQTQAVDAGLDARIEAAALGWEIADALTGLGERHREVLLEVYFQGRSVQEAARRLGVPPGTVKSRTYYALRQLRLLLEERGIGGSGLAVDWKGR
jgi:RNA polymerase sigma-70 factor, ECF subfamily